MSIRELIEAVEAGANWPPLYGKNDLYDLIAGALGTRDWAAIERVTKSYHGSVDAALALMQAVLPGWRWNAGEDEHSIWAIVSSRHGTFRSDGAATPSRALLLAILKAKEGETP